MTIFAIFSFQITYLHEAFSPFSQKYLWNHGCYNRHGSISGKLSLYFSNSKEYYNIVQRFTRFLFSSSKQKSRKSRKKKYYYFRLFLLILTKKNHTIRYSFHPISLGNTHESKNILTEFAIFMVMLSYFCKITSNGILYTVCHRFF